MSKESWRQKFRNVLRIGGAASMGFMPATPLLSPQEFDEQAQAAGHHLILPQLPSEQLSFQIKDREVAASAEQEQSSHTIFTELPSTQTPISWQEWNKDEKTTTIDLREQEKQPRVSVFGMVAEISNQGHLILSLPMTAEKREIILPPVKQFFTGQATLSPDGLKIGLVREFYDGTQFRFNTLLVWTQTGEVVSLLPDLLEEFPGTPRSVGFYWSGDGQKLAVTAGVHGEGRTIGVDVESGQRLFDVRGAMGGAFSPDGQWFARMHGETNLELIGPGDITKVLENASGAYNWSPDSQSIAWIQCSRWQKPDFYPYIPSCDDGTLALYDIKTDQSKLLTVASPYTKSIIFSPDGNTIVYSQPGRSLEDRPAIFNLTTSQVTNIDLISLGIGPKDAYWLSKRLHRQRLVLTGRLRDDPTSKLLWVGMSSGQVVIQQSLATPGDKQAYVIEVFNDKILYHVEDENGHRSFYVAQITQQDGLLSGVQVGSVSLSHAFNSQEVSLFGLVQDGNYFILKGQYFVYQNAKRYWMEHIETREYLGIKETILPAVFAYSIPESETPLRFLPGDVITGPDWAPWYLRNGQRYKINNWDEFAQKQRFNRGIHKELPQWVLDRIPVGQDPSADQARRYGGVIDWDGALKEHQPDGGRMIIFIGGYSSTLTTQQEAFENIKRRLIAQGWSNKQFLEASYHVDQNTQIGGEVIPGSFTEEETRFHPLVSVDKIALQINRYKVMFPETKFILVGHSLGGFLAFNAAQGHPDVIESVITLDGPLKGVDGSLIYNSPFSDQIVNLMGTVVGDYLVAQGNSQDFSVKVESDLRLLQTRGVKIFTFSSANDIMVTTPFAQLVGSDNTFEGQDIRLNWDFGLIPSEASLEEIYARHGDVLKREDFLNQLVVLFPVS